MTSLVATDQPFRFTHFDEHSIHFSANVAALRANAAAMVRRGCMPCAAGSSSLEWTMNLTFSFLMMMIY